MSKLKPVGSETLPLDDKLKRIMEIARYHEVIKEKVSDPNRTTHLVKESSNGFYGVVREKDGYYVKHGLTESSLDYIGGMKMKNKNRFNSYAEAAKRLELIAKPLTEQEKKFVLNKPSVDDDPAAEPAMDDAAADAPPADAEGGETEMPTDAAPAPAPEEGGDMGGEPGGELPEHMKVIQKLTGKLGQRLRQFAEQLKSDDLKYVINSVLSAIDLNKLEDADRDEIAGRFEPDYGDSEGLDDVTDDSEFGGVGGDTGGDDYDDEVPSEDGSEQTPPPAEDEKEMGEEYDDIYENFIRLQKIMKG
jgi:hypothetical protein